MRILFLTNQLGIGGIEKNLVRLTAELTSRGHEVWTASAGGALEDELVQVGGKPLRIDVRKPLASVRQLVRWSVQQKPDVVHAYSAPSALLWKYVTIALKIRGKSALIAPAVSSVMGLQNSPDERAFWTRLRVFLTAVGVKRLIVMAPAIDEVVRSLPIDSGRLVHCSVVGVEVPPDLSVAMASRDQVRQELGVLPEEKMVLSIGNLEPRKSHELFVQAAQIICGERKDIPFFVAGEGHQRPMLEELIADGPCSERITLMGARHDVDRLLTACDIYVRPGIVEGFIGITVLEAQALAQPVIAFELEDVKLAIEDGVTGRLVKPHTAENLAAAISELLTDPALASRLATQGRVFVEEHYSIPRIADNLLDVYGDVGGADADSARRN